MMIGDNLRFPTTAVNISLLMDMPDGEVE